MDQRELVPFAEVERRPAVLGRPTRDFGRLSVAAAWVADRLGRAGIHQPAVVLIAGDHDGPDSGGNSAIAGREQLSRLCADSSAGLSDVDVATRLATDSQYLLRRGHPDPALADAASRDEVLDAIDVGRQLADREIDSGADLLIPGLVGAGHAGPLGALSVALCGMEPVDAVPLPDSDARWAAVVAQVRDTAFRIRGRDSDAISLLGAVGGADLAVLTGLLAEAAARRTPVLLDGMPSLVAAVLAHRVAPGAERWFLAASEPPTKAGRRVLDLLGLPVVADLGTDSWNGTGAVLALGLLRSAFGR